MGGGRGRAPAAAAGRRPDRSIAGALRACRGPSTLDGVASRREQKAELRRQREERERAAAAAARRRRTIGFAAGGGLLAAAAIVLVALFAFRGDGGGAEAGGEAYYPEASVPERKITELEPAARAAGCTLKTIRSDGADQTSAPVGYKTNPPTSGPHRPPPEWASDGVYERSPPAEKLVHSLEHGRVILQFRPSLPASTRGELKALFDEDAQRTILTPNNTGMPYAVAATAWRQLLGCPRGSPQAYDALRAFRTRYRDRGPEYVPEPE